MPLAKPGDPYISETQVAYIPNDAQNSDGDIEKVLGAPIAKNIIARSRRTIKELPIEERTQTAINAVLVFTLLGMTDNEIAHIIHYPMEDINRLKDLPAYQETFDIVFHEFISINSNSLVSKIAAFSSSALDNVMEIASKGKFEMSKLKANQDILDRAGLHPETLHGKNKTDDGFDALKIVITDGEDTKHTVDINLSRGK